MSAVLILVALAAAAALLGYKPLTEAEGWKATLIPLASIMGSGFLVSAPLLANAVGVYAVFAMAALLALAMLVGEALRFNIQHFEPLQDEGGLPHQLEALSQLVLTGAYFVSITYYIQLLAAFALNVAEVDAPLAAPILATATLSIIGGVGTFWGLDSLDRLEKYAVGANLAMILALLTGLLIHNLSLVSAGTWALPDLPVHFSWDTARLLLGLLIVVQGFETSRYIGDEFPAELRVRTMRQAQLLSSLIYVVFLAGSTVLFRSSHAADVTAVIRMVGPVAPVLPLMLTVAALGSQFSAAVADDAGAGGLIEAMTQGRVPPRMAYALIWLVTVILTWETDVNSIISWASRAFALFYAVQCGVAAAVARQEGLRGRTLFFLVLGLICLVVCLFGTGSG
ncbi:MAG: hypothetical protein H6741_20685 [Alphaproteobacteria bacterium]|nr:hypothetical protein [Alphaproteobacteria bacterium]MCB9795126.1 hypothetical protein [Alphaproteobacteria bacterium]